MDLDWCHCGKATQTGRLYCSATCKLKDAQYTQEALTSAALASTKGLSKNSSGHRVFVPLPSPPLAPKVVYTVPQSLPTIGLPPPIFIKSYRQPVTPRSPCPSSF